MVVRLPEVETEDVTTDELKRAYRTAVLIGISMIVTIFLYSSVVETMKPGYYPLDKFLSGLIQDSGLLVLRYILYGASIVLIFATQFLRKKALSTKEVKFRSVQFERFFKFFPDFFLIKFISKFFLKEKSNSPGSIEGKGFSPPVQKLLHVAILTYAFCEAPALYGLVLFFIGKQKFDFYALSAISLISFAVYFPRYPKWEEWMKTANGQV